MNFEIQAEPTTPAIEFGKDLGLKVSQLVSAADMSVLAPVATAALENFTDQRPNGTDLVAKVTHAVSPNVN